MFVSFIPKSTSMCSCVLWKCSPINHNHSHTTYSAWSELIFSLSGQQPKCFPIDARRKNVSNGLRESESFQQITRGAAVLQRHPFNLPPVIQLNDERATQHMRASAKTLLNCFPQTLFFFCRPLFIKRFCIQRVSRCCSGSRYRDDESPRESQMLFYLGFLMSVPCCE